MQTQGLTNWAGSVVFGAARIHQPDTIDEVRRLVAGIPRIRALGSGHSFSLIADTTHDLIRLDSLPTVLSLDERNRTVTVSAGMRYAEVAAELHRAGYALSNMASLPHISVAGSCATGTHGSGDTLRCLAAAVRGLQLVGPDGELRELRRDEDRIFGGCVVALGALGVVTALTLDVEPAFEMSQQVHVGVPLDEIIGELDAVFSSAYSVSVFTTWHSEEGSVWRKRRAGWAESGWNGGRHAERPMHPVDGVSPEFSTEQLDRPGPWHERLPHFRPEFMPGSGDELQSEFYVSRDHASAALSAVRGLAEQLAPVLQIAEIRTVRADDLWLSPAYRRDSVTVHFTWVRNWPAVLPVLAEVEKALRPFDARPHWAKLTTLAGPDIVAGYPRAADFAELMRHLDFPGKFRNAFLDDLFLDGDKISVAASEPVESPTFG
ncbi:FAD-binding protein [Solwaraspora sp. WMMD792]|uniref:FAD-binding protein n=1 Tax=Solwaraspora sp. WMMD792 TaxID=3016099 RepID=UPI00241790CE|nr:FAD-binding protein [Solwaraspora sp. WMMD792]MDG4774266.1 FAD-binding protein [Solwaraspora sp. WMMD792]